MPPRKPTDAAAASDKPPRRAEHLVRALAADILDGARPVGTLLPTENELAEQHGVGAAAVRAALRRLDALGLIARSRGSSPRVVSGEVRASYRIAGAGAAGDYAGTMHVTIERERLVVADGDLAALLGAREGSSWLHISGARLPDDGSFGSVSWVDMWLDTAPGTASAEAISTAEGIAGLLGVGIAEVVEEFAAASLTPAQARNLRARSGTACLHVTRRYMRVTGAPAAVVRDVHPAERAVVSVKLRPG